MTAILSHVQISTALALILGYFSAHAAAFLTDRHAPGWVLGITTHTLATLAAVIPTVAFHPGDNWTVYLGNVVAALFMANQAHRTDAPAAIHANTPGVIGKPRHGHPQAGAISGPVIPVVILVVLIVILLGVAVNHWIFFALLFVLLLIVF